MSAAAARQQYGFGNAELAPGKAAARRRKTAANLQRRRKTAAKTQRRRGARR